MTQGTRSYLFGCHSFVHALLVCVAWRKLYRQWPSLAEFVCIVIHDLGHVGKNYLDDYEEKRQHWRAGAVLARRLFGETGWQLVAGHSDHSGEPRSRLYAADKYSWVFAPTWWLYINNIVEPELRRGFSSNLEEVRQFRQAVRQNADSGQFVETHQIYLRFSARCHDC